jgi:hypothetical protein
MWPLARQIQLPALSRGEFNQRGFKGAGNLIVPRARLITSSHHVRVLTFHITVHCRFKRQYLGDGDRF